VTESEPEWTDEDRAWAVALMEVHADTCAGCNQSLSESTDPGNEGRYEAPEPTRCHACTALHMQQKNYTEAAPGLLFEVEHRG
jgi:hypothetical protein